MARTLHRVSSVRPIVLLVSLFQAGCVIQTITTEVAFKQPSEVALTHGGDTIVPARSGETSQALARGRTESFGVSAAYDAKAIRGAGGSIWIDWDTKLALMEGERTKVLGAEPLVFHRPLAEIFSPSALAARSFVLPLCATIGLRGYRVATWHADTNVLAGECSGSTVVPYALETDWSNVVIHEKTRVNHGLAWMTIALSAFAFGGFAAVIDSASPSNIDGGQPAQIAFTIGIGAIVAAFWGAMIPTLVASDRDVVVGR